MNEQIIAQGIIEYATWLKEYKKHFPQANQRGNMKSNIQKQEYFDKKELESLPQIDPTFEEKKLVYELRNSIETTFSKQIDEILKPLLEDDEQDPMYFILLHNS